MPGFRVDRIDHVELFVPDRDEAAAWYARTLGLEPVPEFAHWAADPRGPLLIATPEAGTKLALFQGDPQRDRPTAGFHLVAFGVTRAGLEAFLARVCENPVYDAQGREVRALEVRDHGGALSVYFHDPYGHRLEVTTYEVGPARPPGGGAPA